MSFQTVPFTDPLLQQLQKNIAAALAELDAKVVPSLQTVTVTANHTIGAEDVLLVDASTAPTDIYLLLPDPTQLTKHLTVKVTKTGKHGVFLKAADVASSTSPQINGANTAEVVGSATVVSTGTQFHTV